MIVSTVLTVDGVHGCRPSHDVAALYLHLFHGHVHVVARGCHPFVAHALARGCYHADASQWDLGFACDLHCVVAGCHVGVHS